MNRHLKVWCPEEEDEPRKPNASFNDLDLAVIACAQKHFNDGDFSEHFRVHVRTQDGKVHRYDVDVHMEPEFYVRRLPLEEV